MGGRPRDRLRRRRLPDDGYSSAQRVPAPGVPAVRAAAHPRLPDSDGRASAAEQRRPSALGHVPGEAAHGVDGAPAAAAVVQ